MPNEEGTAVNEAVEQVTTTPAPATEETKELEIVTEGPELNPNDFQDEVETDAPVADEPKPNDQQEVPELAPKSQNRFQQLANENKELREQLERLDARKAQVAQEQELLDQVNPETGEYYTTQEVERIARFNANQAEQQRIEQQQQSLQTQVKQQTISNEAKSIIEEFPLFNETSPEYNAELAADYNQLLGDNLLYRFTDGKVYTANTLITNGINPETQTLVDTYTSPYQLAKTVANAYNKAAVKAQIKGQRATEKMLSQSDTPSSAPVKQSPSSEKAMSANEYIKAKGLEVVW